MSKEEQQTYHREGTGHKKRSDFWKSLRKLTGNQNPSREQQHMIRRDMLRDPRDGRE